MINLIVNGWEDIEHAHKGMEPLQSGQYLLWGLIRIEKFCSFAESNRMGRI